MPMVPTPASLPSLSQPATMASRNQLAEEKKSRIWFTDGLVHDAGTTQEWTAAALQPLSGTSLKDSDKWKSSAVGRTTGRATGFSLSVFSGHYNKTQ